MEKPKGERKLGRSKLGWGTVLKRTLKYRNEDVDWIHLTRDKDRCWALVNALMNLRVPQNAGNL